MDVARYKRMIDPSYRLVITALPPPSPPLDRPAVRAAEFQPYWAWAPLHACCPARDCVSRRAFGRSTCIGFCESPVCVPCEWQMVADGASSGRGFSTMCVIRSPSSTTTALLAVAALVVMIGRVPIGIRISEWLHLPDEMSFSMVQSWIMNVPNLAAKRAILIGAALGAISTGLKIIVGIERNYLGE